MQTDSPSQAAPAPATTPRRRLGFHHFACFRAYLQNVPLRECADRYLDPGLDLRVAKSTLVWIREEIAAIARRERGAAIAALLKRHIVHIPAPAAPTLAAFAEQFPDGFYAERELLELYRRQVGSDRTDPAPRRARLLERQLAALRLIESVAAAQPAMGDAVAAWFEPNVARRLTAAGFVTLGELVHAINDRGYRWWTQVPRLGERGASRIVRFLAQNQTSLGIKLNEAAATPRRALHATKLARRGFETAVVPMERLYIPSELDGARGVNRAPLDRCKLQAVSDYGAILAWLKLYEARPHTWRAYRREAERYLLWAIMARGKAMSSLLVEDCAAYQVWLAQPQPIAQWIGPRAAERWSPRWRPFSGGLSDASRKTALTILRALCEWLTRQHYLDSNPWDGLPRLNTARIRIKTDHSFSQAHWRFLLETARRLPAGISSRRTNFTLRFAYATGLRLSELVAARIAHLEYVELDQETGPVWMLHVLGKGNIARDVPVPTALMTELAAYLAARGLSEHPARCPPDTPLIARDAAWEKKHQQAPDGAMGASALYKLLKRFFLEAADALEPEDAAGAIRLRQASTHWLRHTHGSHAVADDVPLEVVRNNLGHASLNTTTIYVNTERIKRYREMERFAEKRLTEAVKEVG